MRRRMAYEAHERQGKSPDERGQDGGSGGSKTENAVYIPSSDSDSGKWSAAASYGTPESGESRGSSERGEAGSHSTWTSKKEREGA